MKASTIRIWYRIHKWSSLVCTLILLIACITGLPLVFEDELRSLVGGIHISTPSAGTQPVSLDQMIDSVVKKHPGNVLLYAMAVDDIPGVYIVDVGKTVNPLPERSVYELVDANTGAILPKPGKTEVFLEATLMLHKELFLGDRGEFFVGAMAVLFVLSLVSGAILYGPFMRRLSFGQIRFEKASRVRWLDIHNLLGIVILAWALVVGITGTINSLAGPAFQLWRSKELSSMVAGYRNLPKPRHTCTPQQAVSAAERDEPDMELDFIVPPGHVMAGDHNYSVFMRGKTPLTSQLLKPVLIDAETGRVSAKREMPWYIKTLLLAKPLHFGNYGGLTLKILWAVFDFATIIVLTSGLYLWFAKRKDSWSVLEHHLALIEEEI